MKKYCAYCDTEKDFEDFPPSTSTADRRRNECRICSTDLKRLMKAIKNAEDDSEELSSKLKLMREGADRRKAVRKLIAINLELGTVKVTEVMLDNSTSTKYCSFCERTLPLNTANFHESSHTVDGYRNRCVPCKGISDKLERVYRRYPELKADAEDIDASREERRKRSNQRKYGVDYPVQSSTIRAKLQETVTKRHGVTNYAKHPNFEKKRQLTSTERHGVSNYAKHPDFTSKRLATNLKKYGKKYPNQLDKWILPTGEPIVEYAKKFNKLVGHCRGIYEHYGFEELKAWCEEDRRPSPRTMPEKIAENLLNLQFYGGRIVLPGNQHRYPDFKISDTVYLDVDGLFWHSSVNRDKKYHFLKRQQYESAGIRLLQVRENELSNSKAIVKSMVESLSGKCNSVYARKCKIVAISWTTAKEFFNNTHLQGCGTTSKAVGLLYEGELIQVMSYRKRRKESDSIEIARFSTKLNTRVIGGFSKLLKSITRKELPKRVYSFCDLRYSQGDVYEKAGFVVVKEELGWCWTDFHKTFNRLQCRAGNGNTEAENANLKGWVKLYDAGQRLYLLSL